MILSLAHEPSAKFRDQLIAAPLKQHDKDGTKTLLGKFRDQLIAAPLKL